MRLIVRPITMTSPKMIMGDSNYLLLRNLCDWIDKLSGGKAYFSYLMPLKYRGSLEDTDKIKHYYYPVLFYDWHFIQTFSPEIIATMANRRFGKGVHDALICESSAANPGMDNLMRSLRRPTPIFVRETATAYPGYIHDTVHPSLYREKGIGYYYSSANFFNSEIEKRYALKLMRDYLKPNLILEAEEKCYAVHRGIDVEKVKPAKISDKNKQFTVMFGGRYNSVKNFDTFLEILSKAVILYKIKAVVTTQTQFPSELKDQFPMVEFREGVQSVQFKDMLRKAHVFFSSSMHESYSVTTVEAIALNTVCMLPEKRWVTEGMYSDCPFIYTMKNIDQTAAMLKTIKQGYEDAFKKHDTWRKEFIKDHDRKAKVTYMYNIMKEKIADTLYFKADAEKLSDIRDQLVKEGSEVVNLESFISRYFGSAITDIDMIGSTRGLLIYPGRYCFYRSIVDNGIAEDMFDGPDVNFNLKV